MEYRRLGRTDLRVSLIGLGTMTWGRQNTEAEGHAQMDYALERGVNFWDTAEMYAIPPTAETYGTTETIIGNWLQSRGGRDRIVLATKAIGWPGPGGFPWIRDGKARLDRANLMQAVDDSLRRLQTDYIRSLSAALAGSDHQSFRHAKLPAGRRFRGRTDRRDSTGAR
jgi:aryl-alcohol dehydrogenase-like predicted oxidoreductase